MNLNSNYIITNFQKIAVVSLLFISSIFYAQNNCSCSDLDILKKDIKLDFEDSLKVFKLSNKLKASDQKVCLFNALDLEFEYYALYRHNDKIKTIIEKQEELLKTLNCNSILKLQLSLNKATYYHAISDYENLSKYGIEALRLAEKETNKYYEIEALKHLVFLYTRIDEDEKLWDYTKRAEQLILNNSDDSYTSIKNYVWLGYEYESRYTRNEQKSLIDSSWNYIQKAKKGAKANNLTRELTKIYRALEALSYHKGDIKNGIKYIDTAIYYGKRIKSAKNLSGLYLSKAWDHFDLGELNEAEKWTDTMLKYDMQNDIGGHMMTLVQAAEIYEGTGNLKKSYASYKIYSKLKDSLLNIKRIKAINELESKYQSDLKDAELKLKDSKINKLTILVVISALLIIGILLFTKIRQLREAKKVNEALQNAIDTQLRLEKEIVNVRENIAQDFHDELGNKLARISLLSNLIQKDTSKKDEKIKTKVQQITDDAKSLYMGTRDFIFSLKSNSDCLEEVVTYLSDFGEDFFSKSSIKFQLEKSIEKDVKLPFYWSKQLIYIFKEAMTNALKHSQCSEVRLSFKYLNDSLEIKFQDNGIGINNDLLHSKNGLGHMKKRAKKINGELKISSGKKAGTIIYFKGKTT